MLSVVMALLLRLAPNSPLVMTGLTRPYESQLTKKMSDNNLANKITVRLGQVISRSAGIDGKIPA